MRLRWLVSGAVCGSLVLIPAYGNFALLGQRPGAAPVSAGSTNLVQDSRPVALPPRVAARGRIEPISEVLDLAIGMVGTLAGVYVGEGDSVKTGQLLAEMVNTDQRARVAEAKAQLNLRQAELEKLMHGARPEAASDGSSRKD